MYTVLSGAEKVRCLVVVVISHCDDSDNNDNDIGWLLPRGSLSMLGSLLLKSKLALF